MLLYYFTHFRYHGSLHILPLIDQQKQPLGDLLKRSSPTHPGVVFITTAQLHSTKPEVRFCTDTNPASDVSEIRDGDDIWQSPQLKISLNTFFCNNTTKTTHHLHHPLHHLHLYSKVTERSSSFSSAVCSKLTNLLNWTYTHVLFNNFSHAIT